MLRRNTDEVKCIAVRNDGLCSPQPMLADGNTSPHVCFSLDFSLDAAATHSLWVASASCEESVANMDVQWASVGRAYSGRSY